MRLNFNRYGSGLPVIVLHGLLGSSANWQPFAVKLAEHFEVFTLDLRNHGGSPHALGMSYHQLAEDVAEFIENELSDVPHVLGHSMGGKTGMQTALNYPEKVKSLVAVDIGPQEYSPRHRGILDGMQSLDLRVYKARTQIEDALAPAIPDLATRRFLLKNVGRDSSGRFCWKAGLQEISTGYNQLCDAVSASRPYDGPVLFLKGEQSDYLDSADLPQIRGLFPRARLEIIPRAGHWVQVENPAALMRAVTEFLGAQPA